jgi:hypothetical protein
MHRTFQTSSVASSITQCSHDSKLHYIYDYLTSALSPLSGIPETQKNKLLRLRKQLDIQDPIKQAPPLPLPNDRRTTNCRNIVYNFVFLHLKTEDGRLLAKEYWTHVAFLMHTKPLNSCCGNGYDTIVHVQMLLPHLQHQGRYYSSLRTGCTLPGPHCTTIILHVPTTAHPPC